MMKPLNRIPYLIFDPNGSHDWLTNPGFTGRMRLFDGAMCLVQWIRHFIQANNCPNRHAEVWLRPFFWPEY